MASSLTTAITVVDSLEKELGLALPHIQILLAMTKRHEDMIRQHIGPQNGARVIRDYTQLNGTLSDIVNVGAQTVKDLNTLVVHLRASGR